MTTGQKNNGTTVNASISVNAVTGEYVYTFNDPTIDMTISLTNSSGIDVDSSLHEANDQFLLQNATGDTINGGAGDDTFVVASTSTDLGGNVLHGGAGGVNVVQLEGSGQTVDLTGASDGAAASTGIEVVVARASLSGETVDLNLNQLGASTLTNGGAGPGKAFVALIGSDGAVNVNAAKTFNLMGEVNAAGAGFAADGTPLDAAATAALAGMVTGIGNIEGSLATDYTGKTNLAAQSAVAGKLNAYVFSNGTTSYTIWTDGALTDVTTGVTAYQPAPSVDPASVFGTFAQFSKTGTWSSGTLGINPAGLLTLLLGDGSALAYAAVLDNGVTGTVIHGDNGANGGDWFGLGASGGGNFIFGSPAGDIFDLQNSTALVDNLTGGLGFNVVRATATGADVDLTANNATTGKAAKMIDAVVSSNGAAKSGATQTVEVDPNTLNVVTVGGVKTAVFEAMLGSSASTLTLEGAGKWLEAATFAPGAALPANATALEGGAILDALYNGGKTYSAEADLTGYLFELVGAKGVIQKYVTIYTDATVSNTLAAPSASLMAQAMAQISASTAASSAFSAAAAASAATASALLASGRA